MKFQLSLSSPWFDDQLMIESLLMSEMFFSECKGQSYQGESGHCGSTMNPVPMEAQIHGLSGFKANL